MAHCPLAHGERALLNAPTLRRIGERVGRSAAQVALRWSELSGCVPLPHAASAARMAENLEAALGFT